MGTSDRIPEFRYSEIAIAIGIGVKAIKSLRFFKAMIFA
jgi:hypothetical protein